MRPAKPRARGDCAEIGVNLLVVRSHPSLAHANLTRPEKREVLTLDREVLNSHFSDTPRVPGPK